MYRKETSMYEEVISQSSCDGGRREEAEAEEVDCSGKGRTLALLLMHTPLVSSMLRTLPVSQSVHSLRTLFPPRSRHKNKWSRKTTLISILAVKSIHVVNYWPLSRATSQQRRKKAAK